MPIEPPATAWRFPHPESAGDQDVVGQGADLEPATLLAAYRGGLFPMPTRRWAGMVWWSPTVRGILPLDGLRVTRSLAKSVRRYATTVDAAFDEVIRCCAAPDRPGGWITPEIVAAYGRLHELGWAHSVETWTADGALAGGLYGVAIGGLFAGESMFHHERDASKVALVRLVEELRAAGGEDRRLLDLQWPTPHLESLGAVGIARAEYVERLDRALELSLPPAFDS